MLKVQTLTNRSHVIVSVTDALWINHLWLKRITRIARAPAMLWVQFVTAILPFAREREKQHIIKLWENFHSSELLWSIGWTGFVRIFVFNWNLRWSEPFAVAIIARSLHKKKQSSLYSNFQFDRIEKDSARRVMMLFSFSSICYYRKYTPFKWWNE